MDTLQLIQSIDEAIRIISTARTAGRLASGSSAIWRMSDHAESHLDKQIKELLAAPAENPAPVIRNEPTGHRNCLSVLGGWQTCEADGSMVGPVFDSITDLWNWQAENPAPAPRPVDDKLSADVLELLSYYHKGEVPGHLDACENPDCCQHCLVVRRIKSQNQLASV